MKQATETREETHMNQTGVMLRQDRGKAEWRPIDSWAHASAHVREYIHAHGLTASGETGPMFTGGNIKDVAGRIVARVSYNGKVWGPEPWRTGAIPLFDPYAVGR